MCQPFLALKRLLLLYLADANVHADESMCHAMLRYNVSMHNTTQLRSKQQRACIATCLSVMIARQPVVKLTGINGGHRQKARQEQQHRRRKAWLSHPPASSSEASHPARPI